MNRIKSIDGLRAISILMVIIGHAGATISPNFHQNYFLSTMGYMGVLFFFVISGYLITKLMLIEQGKKGQISIKKFYARRIIRIFPIFYVYILTVVLLKTFSFPDMYTSQATLLFAGFYIWNYKHFLVSPLSTETNGNWYFGHLWSLSMEEQFYIFWPLLFRFTRANILKKIIITLVIAMPFIRVITYFLDVNSRGQITMMLHTAGDTILIGCLGALYENNERVKSILEKIFKKPILIFLGFFYLLILHPYLDDTIRGAYSLTIGLTLRNIVIMVLIFWSIQVDSWFSRFLNTKVMVQIGVISYSIYIWQQLFLSNISFSGQFKFPWNILILTAVAFASYYLLEKPIMNLKNHPKLKRFFV